jgi:hypothetical protein
MPAAPRVAPVPVSAAPAPADDDGKLLIKLH